MKTASAKPTPLEAAEPTAQQGFSRWLVAVSGLLGGLIVWGWFYIRANGGGFHPLVYEPFQSTNQLHALRPRDGGDRLLARGQSLYRNVCALCHGQNGSGDAARLTPPLAGSEWVLAQNPSRLIRIVLHGLQGPITVQGQGYGAAAMLAWRDTLNDDDVAAVLTCIRAAWGNQASPVQPEQVKGIRAATAGRAENWTAAELLQAPEAN